MTKPDAAGTEFGLRLTVTRDQVRVDDLENHEYIDSFDLDTSPVRRRTIKVLARMLNRRRLHHRDELQMLGEQLFEMLFVSDVDKLFRQRLAAATPQRLMSLRLSFDKNTDELAALPWEYLFAPEGTGRGFFLWTRLELVLTRYVAVEGRNPPPEPRSEPLRVLLVVSRPEGLGMKDADVEEVERAIEGVGSVELHTSTEATRTGFIAAMNEHRPHVLHIIGQAQSSLHTGAEIALVDDQGATDLVPENTFADLICDAEWRPPLVVLHLWEPTADAVPASASSEQDDSARSFERLAPVLVRANVPAVVAMRNPLVGDAAKRFNANLYGQLANGETVERAVRYARDKFMLSPTPRFLGSPVLCLHSIGSLVAPAEREPGPVDTHGTVGLPERIESASPATNGEKTGRQLFGSAPLTRATPAGPGTLAGRQELAHQRVRRGRDRARALNLPREEGRALWRQLIVLQGELGALAPEEQIEYLENLPPSEDPHWQDLLDVILDAALLEAGDAR